MGECNYYLKARFKDEEAAASAEGRLAALLAEGEQAYNYWQASRRWGAAPMTTSEFWAGFRKRYPLVIVYLKELAGIPDWDNGLAGHLGCLVDPNPDRVFAPRASLTRRDDLLLLRLEMIWHGTDMTLLERYCQEDLEAARVGSVSAEDLDIDDRAAQEGGVGDLGFDPFDTIWV